MPSGTKICGFQRIGAIAENWTSCRCGRLQLSNKNRSRSFRLDFEPKKTTLFQNLPVESARTAKNRRFTWFYCHGQLSNFPSFCQAASTHKFSPSVLQAYKLNALTLRHDWLYDFASRRWYRVFRSHQVPVVWRNGETKITERAKDCRWFVPISGAGRPREMISVQITGN